MITNMMVTYSCSIGIAFVSYTPNIAQMAWVIILFRPIDYPARPSLRLCSGPRQPDPLCASRVPALGFQSPCLRIASLRPQSWWSQSPAGKICRPREFPISCSGMFVVSDSLAMYWECEARRLEIVQARIQAPKQRNL